jgi:hypothetical protein
VNVIHTLLRLNSRSLTFAGLGPVESWFYGPADSHAIVLVDSQVFAVASARTAG